jgi:hypothetical protein
MAKSLSGSTVAAMGTKVSYRSPYGGIGLGYLVDGQQFPAPCRELVLIRPFLQKAVWLGTAC